MLSAISILLLKHFFENLLVKFLIIQVVLHTTPINSLQKKNKRNSSVGFLMAITTTKNEIARHFKFGQFNKKISSNFSSFQFGSLRQSQKLQVPNLLA
jgi:hypothetical protein